MGKASTAAQNRYIAKKYDRINLTVDKGEKEKIAEYAEKRGESVNGFINRAIKETMERDAQKTDFEKTVYSIEEVGRRDPEDGLLVLPADWDSEEDRAEDDANEKKGEKPKDE